MSKNKKAEQLGMNPSTAQQRLVKDILWNRIVQYEKCHQCGKVMDRGTFSIEHKIPWLDTTDPVKMFFDQENIAFSHHSCNIKAGRKPNQRYSSKEDRLQATLRINRKNYSPEKRREQYLIHGH